MNGRKMNKPQHPGVILRDAIRTIPMTSKDFADHTDISRMNLSRILNAKAKVTPVISVRSKQITGSSSRMNMILRAQHVHQEIEKRSNQSEGRGRQGGNDICEGRESLTSRHMHCAVRNDLGAFYIQPDEL